MKAWLRARRRWLSIAAVVAVVLVVVALSITVVPDLHVEAAADLTDKERLDAQNDIRQTWLQAIAGLVLLAGGVATWVNIQIAQSGQVTERFTRAVDQLGHETDAAVRIGGIYALERIAHDSKPDRSRILELLVAFIRVRAQQGGQGSDADDTAEEAMDGGGRPKLVSRAADVQTALTVLGRLPRAAMKREEDDDDNGDAFYLRDTYLVGANLRRGNLRRGNFRDSVLRGAKLNDADLRGANLRNAKLEKADLRGADLRDAILGGANLRGADASSSTRWPDGFHWRSAGVTMKD